MRGIFLPHPILFVTQVICDPLVRGVRILPAGLSVWRREAQTWKTLRLMHLSSEGRRRLRE